MYNYIDPEFKNMIHGINYSMAVTGFSIGYNYGRKEMMNEIASQQNIKSTLPQKIKPEISSLKHAKSKIKKYFNENHGKEIDYVDLIEAFEYPLPLIVDICEELEKEGKIASID